MRSTPPPCRLASSTMACPPRASRLTADLATHAQTRRTRPTRSTRSESSSSRRPCSVRRALSHAAGAVRRLTGVSLQPTSSRTGHLEALHSIASAYVRARLAPPPHMVFPVLARLVSLRDPLYRLFTLLSFLPTFVVRFQTFCPRCSLPSVLRLSPALSCCSSSCTRPLCALSRLSLPAIV